MKEYNVQITLADNVVVIKKVEAEDELQAIDKIYEHYKNNNIEVYDMEVIK